MSPSRLVCRGSFATGGVVIESVPQRVPVLLVLLFPLPYFLHGTPSGGLHSSLEGNTGRLRLLIHGHTNTWTH